MILKTYLTHDIGDGVDVAVGALYPCGNKLPNVLVVWTGDGWSQSEWAVG